MCRSSLSTRTAFGHILTVDRLGYRSKSHLDILLPVKIGQGQRTARTPRQEREHQRHPNYRLLQD